MSSPITRTAIVFGTLLLTAVPLRAQTIRPLVSEHRSAGRGQFELVNESDRPLNAVVDVKGFSVDENGNVRDEPLPGDVQVKLSAMSVRIPAHQSRFIYYDATAARRPAWFVLYANITGYPRAEFSGLNIQLELPHFVYLLSNEPWKTTDIQVQTVAINHETKKIELVVENTGTQFGRIESLDVKGAGRKMSCQGFPLFPQGRRRVELDWNGDTAPEIVAVKSHEFSFERRMLPQP